MPDFTLRMRNPILLWAIWPQLKSESEPLSGSQRASCLVILKSPRECDLNCFGTRSNCTVVLALMVQEAFREVIFVHFYPVGQFGGLCLMCICDVIGRQLWWMHHFGGCFVFKPHSLYHVGSARHFPSGGAPWANPSGNFSWSWGSFHTSDPSMALHLNCCHGPAQRPLLCSSK